MGSDPVVTSERERERGRTHGGRGSGRRPTLADVARLAGVSPSTVSFVINRRDEGISPLTQRRVLAAVEELGYRPNRAAQTLRTKRTGTIGFVTDEIAIRTPAGQTISGAHDVARERGSVLLIVQGTSDRELLPSAIEDLLDRQVDGIIYATVGTKEASLPKIVHHVTTVLVNCFLTANGLPSIVPDDEAGGLAATELVLTAGHRRVAFIAGHPASWATERRVAGYRRALSAARVAADDGLVRYGNYRADSGYELTRDLLAGRGRPTAILCGNDLMAVGAYFAAKEAGLRIPEDLSVMGYDDQEDLAADLSPALSTVRLPYHDMGHWAAGHILAGSTGGLPPLTYAPCVVVPRASVAGPAGDRRAGRRRTVTRPSTTGAR